MIESLPYYIFIVFIVTTVLTLGMWYWVMRSSIDQFVKSRAIPVVIGLGGWLIVQAVLSINGVYSQDIESLPPKIVGFGVLPTILAICLLFFSKSGRRFIDSMSIKKLTYLNLVRIPVEFVLLWLYLHKLVPVNLTFEGWNFDIAMGLTAPFIIYFGFIKHRLSRSIILGWNLIGIGMLVFVFVLAVLASPFPLQQLAFDQPNIALLFFPFSWLPTFIVPLVILGHLICVRQLLSRD